MRSSVFAMSKGTKAGPLEEVPTIPAGEGEALVGVRRLTGPLPTGFPTTAGLLGRGFTSMRHTMPRGLLRISETRSLMSFSAGVSWSLSSLTGDFSKSGCLGDSFGSGTLGNVSMSATGKYQACGTFTGNNVYLSSNYGQTWTSYSSFPSTSGSYACIAISANGQYQTTANYNTGYIFTSSDYGKTWTQYTQAGPFAWFQVSMSSNGQYQTASTNSTSVYISSNYGKTWTLITPA